MMQSLPCAIQAATLNPVLSTGRSIVLIDTALTDYQMLVESLTPEHEVHLLHREQCGIRQITQVLQAQAGIATLHILSHGRAGQLRLGQSLLNLETLPSYAPQLHLWRNALSQQAEILLYGCELAKGSHGQRFVQQFAAMTGAAVAASTTLTGHRAQGGDWQLQVQTGVLQSRGLSIPAYRAVMVEFSGTTDIGVGTGPESVTLGDVNGDGNLDLLTANYNSRDVSVRLGDGSGGFSSTTDINIGTDLFSVTLGDVNRDGNLDLLTANGGSGTVSVRLGDGSGGFSGTTNINIGAFPYSVTLGDVNGDGNLDLLTANNGSDTVSVRLGDGSGNFSGTTSIGVGAFPYSVTLGDVNSDGNLDLLTANRNSNDVSVRLGDGSGNFSGTTSISVGSSPQSVTLGDVNGDGNLDLLTANTFSNNVSVRLGDGSGGFSGTTDIGVGTFPGSVTLGDVNGDGKLDLLTANTFSNDVSVRLGDGSGNFSGTTSIGVGAFPFSVTLGDVNGDGKLDLLTANRVSNNVSVRLNTTPRVSVAAGINPVEGSTTGTFTITLDQPAPTGGLTVNFSLAGTATNGTDYSLDQTASTNITAITNTSFTIAAGQTTATLAVVAPSDSTTDPDETISLTLQNSSNYLLGNPTARFTSAAPVGVGSIPYSVTVGDVNGDGNLDLLSANYGSNTVSVRLGDGSGGFSGTTNISVGFNPQSVTLGDVNGDGNLDLLSANNGSNTVSVRLGDGSGGFSGTTNISVGILPQSVTLGDVNGDGNLDLLTANYTSNNVSVRLGDGSGGFSGTTNISVGANPQSVALGDVNRDGNLDLLSANNGSNDVSVRLGDGSGNFSGTTSIGVGSNPYSVALRDVNGDGNLDLLTANNSSNDVSVRLGDGSGGFSGTTSIGVGSNPRSVTLGDVNGDGNLDLLAANIFSNNISVILSQPGANLTISNGTQVVDVRSITPDGSYKAGDTILLTVTFSEIVNVTGTPQLTLETGASDAIANYSSGSGTTTLTFSYVVAPGDTSSDLDYTSSTALTLNGGTIQNTSGTNALLTLPAPSAANSLSANQSLVIGITAPIDTTAPSPPTISRITNDSGSTIDRFTNDNTPSLSGTAEAGSTVAVFAGSLALGTTQANTSGQWSLALTQPLADGSYSFTATATDAASNTSPSSTPLSLTIDTVPAQATILELAEPIREASVNQITIQFNESVRNFDLSDLALTRNGQPIALSGASLSSSDNQNWILSNLNALTAPDGSYQLSLRSQGISDAAGNALPDGKQLSWLTGDTGTALQPANYKAGQRGINQRGTTQADRLVGSSRNDILVGAAGNDRIGVGSSRSRFGRDRLYGGVGNDQLYGGRNNDYLNGGSGQDYLNGGSEKDLLLGREGRDRLLGQQGRDVLVGGNGNDRLSGGRNRDMFVFNRLDEGTDSITDFNSREDVIDLRNIFKATQYSGDNRFAQFYEFVRLTQVGRSTAVQVDADGRGSRTAVVTLAILQKVSATSLSANNFVLG